MHLLNNDQINFLGMVFGCNMLYVGILVFFKLEMFKTPNNKIVNPFQALMITYFYMVLSAIYLLILEIPFFYIIFTGQHIVSTDIMAGFILFTMHKVLHNPWMKIRDNFIGSFSGRISV